MIQLILEVPVDVLAAIAFLSLSVGALIGLLIAEAIIATNG